MKPGSEPLARIKFQFHKGTIRTSKPTTRRLLNANFNSIKVQLELQKLLPLGSNASNFNSIKVQLERMAQDGIRRRSRFQFHKGTIRTNRFICKEEKKFLFQFHKGTIRTSAAYRSAKLAK